TGATGAAGATGATGAAGATGRAGPAGVSAANEMDNIAHTFAGPGYEKILGRNFGEGNYVFIAKADLSALAAAADDLGSPTAGCELRVGANPVDFAAFGGQVTHGSSGAPVTVIAI